MNEYILQPSETEGEEGEEPSRRRTRRVSAKVITPALLLHWFYIQHIPVPRLTGHLYFCTVT